MAIFRIFPVLTKKVKRFTSNAFKRAGRNSIDWFKDRITATFGKDSARAGTFNRDELKAQQDAMRPRPAAKVKPPPTATRRAKPVRTPEQEISQGISSKSKVAANDPATQAQNKHRGINRQLKQNTTLGPEFKKNLRNTGRPLIGHMYFYIYDPKWKKILPYYDVFPLVIPLDYYDDGFLGMNLHYLPYILRAQLLDWLMSLSMSTMVGGKESKYMAVSYGVLKGLAGSKNYAPTIKRYLYSHVKSPFAEVLHEEWENAAFLPVEQFRKAGKREVWAESRKKV